MDAIPRAVLSEHFQERMKGRRLRSAVFLTFQFDPGFFEQEVLPVFVDIALSHAAAIRLVQLEQALLALPGSIAVYYDAHGIIPSDSGSAKLDVRRIPIRHSTGIFHPKNVFLLVDDEEPDEDGHHPQTLIIASLSANLTRSGWWENVEACHVEEVGEGDRTRLKDETATLLRDLRRKTPAEREHLALRDILDFLRSTDQRRKRSADGHLHAHFYASGEPLVDFLDRTAGTLLRGTYLEVISPYFDDAGASAPLQALVDRFQPKEVRVYLPRSASGEALCRRELFESVRAMPGVLWGKFPREIVRLGQGEEAGERQVHAKLYRFFTQSPKREITFVGSVNLTTPAHSGRGNLETGFLFDHVPERRPEFLLASDHHKPVEFLPRTEDQEAAASGGTRLNLRYHWDREIAEAYWDSNDGAPPLRLEARGVEIGAILPLAPRVWVKLSPDMAMRIRACLDETSLFFVHGEGPEPTQLLVQEEGMSHKPSLLFRLTAADILRYWSLLSTEQRAAFLEARAPELAMTGQGADLVNRAKIALEEDTVFDRFAGIFHAFGCLERSVREALATEHTKEADYRLFGKKYDSLGSLLDRVGSEKGIADMIDDYVIVLCAKQLCQEVAPDFPDYWTAHRADVRSLEARFEQLQNIRNRLIETSGGDFDDFLKWFDQWFLRRAAPVEGGAGDD